MSKKRPLTRDEVLTARRFWSPRPAPRPAPTARWDAAPCACISINNEWVSHVAGLLSLLQEKDSWSGTDTQIQDAIDQAVELESAMSCACDASDVGKANVRIQVRNLLVAQAFNLVSIFPSLPDKSFTENTGDDAVARAKREDALCLALATYLSAASNNLSNDVRSAMLATLGLAGPAAVFAGGPTVLLGGFVLAGIGAGVADALNNACAVRNVICCARLNLKDAAITRGAFKNAMNGCAFDIGSDEWIVQAVLKLAALDEEGFFQFASILADAQTVPDDAGFDIGSLCACCNECVEFDMDFKVSPGAVRVAAGSGLWVPGAGWQGEEQADGQFILRLFVDFDDCCPDNNTYAATWKLFSGGGNRNVALQKTGCTGNPFDNPTRSVPLDGQSHRVTWQGGGSQPHQTVRFTNNVVFAGEGPWVLERIERIQQ